MRANQLSKALLAESPSLPRYQALHAQALQSLASQQSRIGRLKFAEDNLLDALSLYDRLSSGSRQDSRYDSRRAHVLELLVVVLTNHLGTLVGTKERQGRCDRLP